jgi:hypothetical protein
MEASPTGRCSRDRVRDCRKAGQRQALRSIAEKIIAAWEASRPHGRDKEPDRGTMIALLARLGDVDLLERFVAGAVTRDYDGTENRALAAAAKWLGAEKAGPLFSSLARESVLLFPGPCSDLLKRLAAVKAPQGPANWTAAVVSAAAAIVDALPRLGQDSSRQPGVNWWRASKSTPAGGTMVADLIEALGILNGGNLCAAACSAIVENRAAFDPATVIVPALQSLDERGHSGSPEFRRLWRHAAEFLLARSERPPEPPTDWRQELKVSCRCGDCRELEAFAANPDEHIHRFRVAKDRRGHLHRQIETHHLDMKHETERIGSPQTLVCTKTRGAYERQCRQYHEDLATMNTLLAAGGREIAPLAERLSAAAKRLLPARAARAVAG